MFGVYNNREYLVYLSLELLIAICNGEHSSPMNGRLTWCRATWQRLVEALVDESKVAQHVVTHQWLEETEKTATLFSGRKHSQFESQFLQTFSWETQWAGHCVQLP